jgi:hypothetical protein
MPCDKADAAERPAPDPLAETTRKGLLFVVSGTLLLTLALILRLNGFH